MITGITPYLTFNGKCEEAISFYVQTFGGEIKQLMRVSDGPKEYHNPEYNNQIMHATATIGKATIMASDSMGNDVAAGSNVALSLDFTSEEEITAAFKKMCEGGKVLMELQDTFWEAKFGTLQDKFGINWMFNFDKNPQSR
jgi:PhnB protein